jgi:very-short-patch-repair endonuclease
MPLGSYIADLYCAPTRLVVEVDGVSHIDSRTDAARDAWMGKQGIPVLRVANFDVLSNLEGVLLAIQAAARSTPRPAPPLLQGEGEKVPVLSPASSHV